MKCADIPWSVTVVTPPVSEPVSLEEVKTWLRVDTAAEDALLSSLIQSAVKDVERDTGLRLLTQVVDLGLDAFPDDAIRIPVGPVTAVTSITTTSSAGASAVLDAANYLVDLASLPARITLSATGAWPTDLRLLQPITIRLTAGYTTAAAVPAPLRTLVSVRVLWYHEAIRQADKAQLDATERAYAALITPYRLEGLAT